jgi:hypothetical protein
MRCWWHCRYCSGSGGAPICLHPLFSLSQSDLSSRVHTPLPMPLLPPPPSSPFTPPRLLQPVPWNQAIFPESVWRLSRDSGHAVGADKTTHTALAERESRSYHRGRQVRPRLTRCCSSFLAPPPSREYSNPMERASSFVYPHPHQPERGRLPPRRLAPERVEPLVVDSRSRQRYRIVMDALQQPRARCTMTTTVAPLRSSTGPYSPSPFLLRNCLDLG